MSLGKLFVLSSIFFLSWEMEISVTDNFAGHWKHKIEYGLVFSSRVLVKGAAYERVRFWDI